MALDFRENRKYALTSIGASEKDNLPMDVLLFNVFRKLERRANPIKVMLYLIQRERSCRNFRVGESDAVKFCNLGSGLVKALKELVDADFIEWNEKTIMIRYDKLTKE